MKLLIVLALFGAAFAVSNEEVEPVMLREVEPVVLGEVEPVLLGEAPSPDLDVVDFGHLIIPESVLRELALERSGSEDEPSPVHFVNENGDIQSFVDDAPVDAPVEYNYENIAPVEVEPVVVVDNLQIDTNAAVVEEQMPVNFFDENGNLQPFMYGAPVYAPVEEDLENIAPVELEAVRVENVDFDTNAAVDKVKVVDVAVDGQDSLPEYRGKIFPDPLLR